MSPSCYSPCLTHSLPMLGLGEAQEAAVAKEKEEKSILYTCFIHASLAVPSELLLCGPSHMHYLWSMGQMSHD